MLALRSSLEMGGGQYDKNSMGCLLVVKRTAVSMLYPHFDKSEGKKLRLYVFFGAAKSLLKRSEK